MKIAVLQSNYIPWKGYFDIIHDVELFIFHDDLQYTKNDWRNRNKIKTFGGSKWLSIPVGTNEHRLIQDVPLPADNSWQKKHFDMLKANYQKAPYWKAYEPFLSHVYLEGKWETLVELDRFLITSISREYLGISTRFATSLDYAFTGAKHEKLLTMLQSAGASAYVSGPAAKDYIVAEDFQRAGIELIWKDYGGYPEYPQPYPPFDHAVSILDLLLCTGPDAPYFIWGWREG